MNTDEALRLANTELDRWAVLAGWRVELTNAKRQFGVCRHGRRVIGLSRVLVEVNDRAHVEDTIRHEIAHALAGPDAGHGQAWKRSCLLTGANPVRLYDSRVVTAAPAPYYLVCEVCGKRWPRYRRPARNRVHWHEVDHGTLHLVAAAAFPDE